MQGTARPGKARPGKARSGEARRGQARRGVARRCEARRGAVRQGQARRAAARTTTKKNERQGDNMAIKSIGVTIKGTSPLLMHAFPLEPIEAIEKQSAERQAEHAAYRDESNGGGLYVPGVNLQRALIAAATYSKGKGRASLQKPAAACLQVSPEHLDLGLKTYAIDSRPVVMPSTKGRILRHRPRIEAWQLTFDLDYDDTLLKATEVRTIVDNAGARVGLCDYRPEKKGPFGKFIVTEWKD